MLSITLPKTRFFSEETERFITFEEKTVVLEHSLYSLADWESKTKKRFLTTFSTPDLVSEDDIREYIRCMAVNHDVTVEDGLRLTQDIVNQVFDYINDPMTATTVTHNDKDKKESDPITAEVIYCWMCHFRIPSEYQYWHLNRLLMLIDVCNEKEKPTEKESKADAIARTRAQNQMRRAKLRAKGLHP